MSLQNILKRITLKITHMLSTKRQVLKISTNHTQRYTLQLPKLSSISICSTILTIVIQNWNESLIGQTLKYPRCFRSRIYIVVRFRTGTSSCRTWNTVLATNRRGIRSTLVIASLFPNTRKNASSSSHKFSATQSLSTHGRKPTSIGRKSSNSVSVPPFWQGPGKESGSSLLL